MIEKQILVIIKNPGEEPSVEPLFENSLPAFENAVGGELSELQICTDLVLLYNRDGVLIGKPFNFAAFGVEFYGTVVAVGVKNKAFASLKAANVPYVLKALQGKKEQNV